MLPPPTSMALGRRYGGPNGYGHQPDPEDHQRTHVRVMFAREGIDHTLTPAAASNRDCGPGVFDQGAGDAGTSSCTGHAVSGSVSTTLKKQGTPLSAPPSQDEIYKIGRCIDRHPGPNGKRPALEDVGAMPNQVMRGLTEFGARPMRGRAPDGRYSDADPATINDEPDLEELEDDAECKLDGQYAIPSSDPHFIDLVRAAIAAGYCVCFAIFVDTVGPRSVEGWDPSTGPLSAPATPGDRAGGPHYVYADGYRTTPAAKTIIEWVNSWGTNWGLAGYGEGDEAFMRGWSNVVVMKVRRVTPPTPAAAAA